MRRQRGFTLIELMVVVTIVGILAAMAAIQVRVVLRRAKENVMRHDLRVMRDAIAQYLVDKKKCATSKDNLVDPEQPYLRGIPSDPITGTSESWEWIMKAPDDPDDPDQSECLVDVKSGAAGNDIDGVPYSEY